MIGWSFDLLSAAGCRPIVTVLPRDHLETGRSLLEDAICIEGGPTRQASVRAGLGEVRSSVVVVHDAARPFASPQLVARLLEALADHEGAIAAQPLHETLKRVEADEVTETVDRSSLWISRTPQAFRTESLRAAHARAEAEGFEATDDAQLIERYGGSVAVVRDSGLNLKITSADDLKIARDLAQGLRR